MYLESNLAHNYSDMSHLQDNWCSNYHHIRGLWLGNLLKLHLSSKIRIWSLCRSWQRELFHSFLHLENAGMLSYQLLEGVEWWRKEFECCLDTSAAHFENHYSLLLQQTIAICLAEVVITIDKFRRFDLQLSFHLIDSQTLVLLFQSNTHLYSLQTPHFPKRSN